MADLAVFTRAGPSFDATAVAYEIVRPVTSTTVAATLTLGRRRAPLTVDIDTVRGEVLLRPLAAQPLSE
jgi:hypothetical protein